MRRTMSFLGLLIFAGLALGCGSSESSFSNKLALGTGIGGPTYFDLVGESTTFSVAMEPAAGLAFRLESAEDMGGRAVRIYVNNGTYGTHDFKALQDYGHIYLSSFRITDVGTFTVKGMLVAQIGPDIGKETFVAETTVVVTK